MTYELLNSYRTISDDLGRIYHGLFFAGCMCRPITTPCVKTFLPTDKISAPPVFLLNSELGSSCKSITLLGMHPSVNPVLPCSFTRTLQIFPRSSRFILEMVDFPSLEPVPILLSKSDYAWCLNVKLALWCLTTADYATAKKLHSISLSLEPRFNLTQSVVRWFSSVHVLDSPRLHAELHERNWYRISGVISLSALITADLLGCALHHNNMQVDVQVNLACGADYYRFVINPCIDLSFPHLMTQLTKFHRLDSVSSPMASLVPSICPCRQTWFACLPGFSAHSVFVMLHNLFESKLGAVRDKTTHSDQSTWFWLSVGPLVGLAVRLELTDTGCDSVILEARCSRQTQLDLLPEVLNKCAEHLKLEAAPAESRQNNLNAISDGKILRVANAAIMNPKVSSCIAQLRPLVDTLLLEVNCLADLVSDLIGRTMRVRITPIEEILTTSDNCRINLARRASDWFAKVSTAHLTPVESTEVNEDYLHCMHKTDVVFGQFCSNSTIVDCD